MKTLLDKTIGVAALAAVLYMWNPLGLIAHQQVDAIYYPDGDGYGDSIHNDDIGSLEACREWAQGRIADSGHGGYGCGINPDASGVYEDIVR